MPVVTVVQQNEYLISQSLSNWVNAFGELSTIGKISGSCTIYMVTFT